MKSIFTILIAILSVNSFARDGNQHSCSADISGGGGPVAKTTLAATEEADYDVKYVKFDISLNNLTTDVSGDVSTMAQVIASPGMSVYAFELDPLLTIDSFKLNGQPYAVQTTGYVRRVNLSPAISQGSLFTAQVYYHGQPTPGTGFFTHGLNLATLSSGTHLLYSVSDMYLAKDWWPCKQDILDKIDSTDIWITVPDTLRAGCNGLLKAITPMPGAKARFEWKTKYPIDYYLLCASVAPYSDYSYYMHYTDGSGDSMLIQNYVYDSASFMTPGVKAALDTTGLIVDYFSTLFGRYPYYKEKYGHCMAEPLQGGMEHQTMTTLAYAVPTLISHELGHQWWGDHVTYGSWADMWLSEGFASYCEQLFVEHFWGTQQFKDYRTATFNKALVAAGSVYVTDTNNVSRVFDQPLTYWKGASVVHMLRYMAPADSLFFKALRQYQQQYAFGNAITPDLKAITEQVYNIDLDTFYDQWIYKEGYPTYAAKWDQKGNDVYVQINQATSKPSSVAYFSMPLELNLKSASGDMRVKVYNNQKSQNYHFTWANTMTGLEIDPDNNVLNKTGSIAHEANVGVDAILSSKANIYPNPATEGWNISNIYAGSMLQLSTADGKSVWREVCNADRMYIPAYQLPAGVYILTITKNNISKNYKLVK